MRPLKPSRMWSATGLVKVLNLWMRCRLTQAGGIGAGIRVRAGQAIAESIAGALAGGMPLKSATRDNRIVHTSSVLFCPISSIPGQIGAG